MLCLQLEGQRRCFISSRDGKKGILDLYHRAVTEPYGFLYADLMQKDPAEMFKNKRFEPLGL